MFPEPSQASITEPLTPDVKDGSMVVAWAGSPGKEMQLGVPAEVEAFRYGRAERPEKRCLCVSSQPSGAVRGRDAMGGLGKEMLLSVAAEAEVFRNRRAECS